MNYLCLGVWCNELHLTLETLRLHLFLSAYLQNNKINRVATMSDSVCAACGKSGDGLKACVACKTVKYCNRDCQQKHWSAHKQECKRQADVKLFQQPPQSEDCPVCFPPYPLKISNQRTSLVVVKCFVMVVCML
jgi:hypothetical protein